ncbi:hypothetical protein Tco_0190042 [Tanacetum coccineum]
MSTLKFADTHNMVAFLSKPTKSDGFEQIVDFLNAHPIRCWVDSLVRAALLLLVRAKKEQWQRLMLIINWLKDCKQRPRRSCLVEEKATLFQQLLEKRRKHFADKRAEEKRNKPPTKA